MNLPPDWKSMTLDALYAQLDEPRRFPTPQSTIEAIMYCVRERGIAALKEPDNIEKLSRCDKAARKQLNERIETLLAKKASGQ
jgi:hypothetical protein